MRSLDRDVRYAWRRLRALPSSRPSPSSRSRRHRRDDRDLLGELRAVLCRGRAWSDPDRLITIHAWSGCVASAWPCRGPSSRYQTHRPRSTGSPVAIPAVSRRANGGCAPRSTRPCRGVLSDAGVRIAVVGRFSRPTIRPDAPPVTVLSHATWRALFDADSWRRRSLRQMNGAVLDCGGCDRWHLQQASSTAGCPDGDWRRVREAAEPTTRIGVSFDRHSGQAMDQSSGAWPRAGRRGSTRWISASARDLNAKYPDADEFRPRRGEAAGRPTAWAVRPGVAAEADGRRFLLGRSRSLMTCAWYSFCSWRAPISRISCWPAVRASSGVSVRLALGGSRWRLYARGWSRAACLPRRADYSPGRGARAHGGALQRRSSRAARLAVAAKARSRGARGQRAHLAARTDHRGVGSALHKRLGPTSAVSSPPTVSGCRHRGACAPIPDRRRSACRCCWSRSQGSRWRR